MNGFALIDAFHMARYRVVHGNSRFPIIHAAPGRSKEARRFKLSVLSAHNKYMRVLASKRHPFR